MCNFGGWWYLDGEVPAGTTESDMTKGWNCSHSLSTSK